MSYLTLLLGAEPLVLALVLAIILSLVLLKVVSKEKR
jgi:hypothetical protein